MTRQLVMDVALIRYVSPSMERFMKAAAARLGLTLEKYRELLRARKKHCCGCSQFLDATVDVFGVCRKQWDGLNSICRQCRSDYDRVRRSLAMAERWCKR